MKFPTCTKECSWACRATERGIRFAYDRGRWYAYAAHDLPACEGYYGAWYETLAEGETRADVERMVAP